MRSIGPVCPFRAATNNRRLSVVGNASGGFGKKAPPKAKPEPVTKTTPAAVDPKRGWRNLGVQSSLFESKPVKGVEVPSKTVAVYLHNGKVYCRCD